MKKIINEMIKRYSYFNGFDIDSNIDYLTNTLDRKAMIGFVNNQIEHNESFAIAIFDFDNFKRVNDLYGHSNGDIALKEVARVIATEIKEYGIFGRFGGDEFIVYFDNENDYDGLWAKLRAISLQIKAIKFENQMSELMITQTIGSARFPYDASSYEELFQKVDKALYRGKQKGRNCFIIYRDEIHKDVDVVNTSLAQICKKLLVKAYKVLMDFSYSIDEKIDYVFDLLSTRLGVDHLSINTDSKLLNEYIKEGNKLIYKPINNAVLRKMMTNNMYYTNNISSYMQNAPAAFQSLYDQKIKAIFTYDLVYNGKSYGIARIEDSSHKRVWQDDEVICYIAIFNVITLLKAIEEK